MFRDRKLGIKERDCLGGIKIGLENTRSMEFLRFAGVGRSISNLA